MAEQALLGIAILQNGRVTFANQAVAQTNGYDLAQILTWTITDVAGLIHPADRAFAIEQARRKERGDTDTVAQYAYRIMHRDGSVRWLEQYSKTVEYHGAPADLICLVDITERKRAEASLRA